MSSVELSPVVPLAPACADYAAVTDVRASDPGAVARAWNDRTTRPTIRGDGRLMIVAADPPARGALSVGNRPTAMNSRAARSSCVAAKDFSHVNGRRFSH